MLLGTRRIKGKISGSIPYGSFSLKGEACSIKTFKSQLKRWSSTTWGSDIATFYLDVLHVDHETKQVYFTPSKPFASIQQLTSTIDEKISEIPSDYTVYLGYDKDNAKPLNESNLRLFLKGDYRREITKPQNNLGILYQPTFLIAELI